MVYNELCHKETDWSKAMKQILIKLTALGLLFSVVSTYACDSCGCKDKERVDVLENNKGNPTVTFFEPTQ